MRRTMSFVRRFMILVIATTSLSFVGTGTMFTAAVASAEQPLFPGGPMVPTLEDLIAPLQQPIPPVVLSPPPSVGEMLNQVVPAPVLPPTPVEPSLTDSTTIQPEAIALGVGDLAEALLPPPTGDPFFDTQPADLADYANGQLIDWRDVTQTSSWMVGGNSQVRQVKFRSNDGADRMSIGTATLVTPAVWKAGDGVVINNLPIDALGAKCTVGYTMSHGIGLETGATDFVPPVTVAATLLRGYAVLLVDHEGPLMAYADAATAGHVILDAVRAVRAFDDRLAMSKYVMTGYSGGAIATDGAAKRILTYAPELQQYIVGAAPGGAPIDKQILSRTMVGELNWAKGIFGFAALAESRIFPQIIPELNNPTQAIATYTPDLCIIPIALTGFLPLPIDILSNTPNPLDSNLAHEIFSLTNQDGMKYGTPLFVYNGAQEFWIVPQMAEALFREQCSLGVPSVLRLVPGEHLIAAVTGFPELMLWIDARLQGVPAPNEC